MNELNRRVNSIVVKNLPISFTVNQLEELFSPFGRIVSSRVLPFNPNFEGGCGFVNYADAESSNRAVEHMDSYVVDGFTLRVSHSTSRTTTNGLNRTQNVLTTNNEPTNRMTTLTNTTNSDEIHNGSPPNPNNRFNNTRTSFERLPSISQSKPMSIHSANSSTYEFDATSNGTSPLPNGKMIVNPLVNIDEHQPLIPNQTYNIYLSNLEVPNFIFAATLDDYVNATLLIAQMNKHEKLAKIQGYSYNTKFTVGQICAALFNKDWYRARILEVGENRVRVQYIDWGNTGWCDSTLEIRPLPNEYYKDPALCVKCILDGVPSNQKLSTEQTNAILSILVLDLKLEMSVVRIENDIPHVQLKLGERNLNDEVRAIFSSSIVPKQNLVINFDSYQPVVNLSDTHYVQLTTVDVNSDCFYVLLMRDCLFTIMNTLKDWNTNKQPLKSPPKANTLVCAQYEADDLWYRAWIQKVTGSDFHVYFVDFGNDEIVSIDRLSDCPEILRTIPWECIKVKLANITLSDDERYILLRDYETDRLEMKILNKQQDIYQVDLVSNGKSLVNHILELRKKQPPKIVHEVSKTSIPEPVLPSVPQNLSTPIDSPIQSSVDNSHSNTVLPTAPPIVNVPVSPALSNSSNVLQSNITTNSVAKQVPTNEPKNDDSVSENILTLINEQRRQNRLLEQVIAAINTTNALLNQLVQRGY